jgi:hypothetical protein
MVYAGLVFAGLAALLHVYIFVMESLTCACYGPERASMMGSRFPTSATMSLAASMTPGRYVTRTPVLALLSRCAPTASDIVAEVGTSVVARRHTAADDLAEQAVSDAGRFRPVR